MIDVYLAELCRLLLSITLTAAAVGKLSNMRLFANSLKWQLHIPSPLVMPLAWAVSTVEAALAALMLIGEWSLDYTLIGTLVLLSGFSILIATVVARKKQVFCNCFGQSTQPLSVVDLVRNGILVLATLGAWVFRSLHPNHLDTQTLVLLGSCAFIIFLQLAYLKTIFSVLHSDTSLAND